MKQVKSKLWLPTLPNDCLKENLLLKGYRSLNNGFKKKTKKKREIQLLLTLGKGGVGGTAPFPEADWGTVVGLPILGSQCSHSWVGRPGTQERCRGNTRGRAVGRNDFTQRGRILQQTEIAVHRAHVVANVRVHATHGRILA